MPDVVMPRLSDSMEEGTILRWLKADGDEVERGEELAEIETDKATMTYEADADGVLAILAKEGDTLPIGEVIATIGGGGGGDGAAKASEGAKADATESAAAGEAPAQQVTTGTAQEPARAPQPATNGASPGGAGGGERIKASPVARRIAKDRGVDLTSVRGTGPGGRIVKADVEGAPAGASAPAPAPAPAAPASADAAAQAPPPPPAPVVETGTAKGDVRHEELSRTQQVVARRMAESKATVPEFTVQTEVDMERAVQARARLKELAATGGDPVPSYNDLVVKASAIALTQFPRANAAYRDGRFELFSRVNVGIAVASENALIVPTVFDADRKGLAEIARDTRALAERVRAGVVTPPELSGGTFTVSNLGMFGVTAFTAVINPPQAAILAVGSLEQRAVVRDGQVVARHTMSLTLVSDHRILYGADAAQFLARIRALLEEPLGLAL